MHNIKHIMSKKCSLVVKQPICIDTKSKTTIAGQQKKWYECILHLSYLLKRENFVIFDNKRLPNN
jgi:hypothetical protein